MADPTARELKLIQYLNEAYGKEKQLETALQAQIKLAQKPPLKKRLQEHLKETKAQAKGLEKRIKQLGGKAEAVDLPLPDFINDAVSGAAAVANKAVAAAKGPVMALRGTSPADNQLRNVRHAFWNEAEEIANYDAIEALAENLGDKETAKLAKDYRRQEQRMQTFLEKQIPRLVKDVIRAEIPARERKPAGATTTRRRASAGRSASRRSSAASASGGRRKAAASSSGARKTAASSARKPASTRSARSTNSGGSSTARRRAASTRSSSGGGSSGSGGSSS